MLRFVASRRAGSPAGLVSYALLAHTVDRLHPYLTHYGHRIRPVSLVYISAIL